MLDIISYYARCNKIINKQMLDIIENIDKNQYSIKTNGYFKSFGEILDHIYTVDIIWLNTFASIDKYNISNNDIFKNIPDYGQQVFSDFISYRKKREELDDIIIQYSQELKESDLNKMLVRYNKKGEKMEKILWKSLIHFFNHQTHHRGHISQVLDEMNIENNYSNMIHID